MAHQWSHFGFYTQFLSTSINAAHLVAELMSRFKKFTRSLASGYLLLGTNIVYTLGSVPIALHYLSKEQFGLWAVVMQVSGYLQLIDLGMAGSISRILIDHKDSPANGVYGSVIKTGLLVLALQGLIIALAGWFVSIFLPDLLVIPQFYRREFKVLVAGQCAILGLVFAGRMSNHVLQAHQRYDASNYSQMGSLMVNLGTMWASLASGLGLYSLLVGYAAAVSFGTVFTLAAAARLKLFPASGSWGHVNQKTFQELFAYGREIFLLSVGWQLVNASQVVVISRTLGLEAAGIWSIATKPFTLAQQVVNRLLDFSSSALAEMIVRQERERLLARFRDLVILSASFSAWAGLAVGLCNHSFLSLWTKDRVSWQTSSDWLMAGMVIVYSTTRCYIGFIGLTKQIRGMKYVYLLEGVLFVGVSLIVAPVWGINGIIATAIVTDLLCSGLYGFWRTKDYFDIRETKVLLDWLRWPLVYLFSLATVFGITWWVERLWWSRQDWQIHSRLGADVAVAFSVGLVLFWLIGLTPHLRSEIANLALKIRTRLRPV